MGIQVTCTWRNSSKAAKYWEVPRLRENVRLKRILAVEFLSSYLCIVRVLAGFWVFREKRDIKLRTILKPHL